MFTDMLLEKVRESGCTKTFIANKCGWTPQMLQNKFKLDNFREADMVKLADALGYELKLKLVRKKRVSKGEEE